MTILVDWQIRERCLKALPGLVVPYNEDLLNPCSIDICVGATAKLRIVGGYMDIDLTQYTKEYPYIMNPGDRTLVASLETFNFPDDIAGQFKLKSSRGREWYEQLEAGWCEPGWNNSKLTMEIIAHDVSPLPLYPGLRIGQIVFYKLSELPEVSYKNIGRYNNDQKVQESRG